MATTRERMRSRVGEPHEDDHECAKARYSAALPLFRKVGDVLGEANCIRSLGDIALECSDHSKATAHYEQALPLFRQVGDVLGEANCIFSLGETVLAQSDHEGAKRCFEQALALYLRIEEPYTIGMAHFCLAQVSSAPAVRADHVRAAREAWTRINRPDLVRKLDDEFGAVERLE